jgi:replicative DNA helicase
MIASAVADWGGDGARLLDLHRPEIFSDERHRAIWSALREMRAGRLSFDWATVQRLVPDAYDYLRRVAEARPGKTQDLPWHEANVVWDRQVTSAAEGPLTALLAEMRGSRDATRTRALAKAVSDALQGGSGHWLLDKSAVVEEAMADIRARVSGQSHHPYGIPGLDQDESGRRRLVTGATPGQITVVTGLPGSGKSTLMANLVIALTRQGKRVLYGAWEMTGRVTIELLAAIVMGISRSRLKEGSSEVIGDDGVSSFIPLVTEEELTQLKSLMEQISEYVTFMPNRFRSGRRWSPKKSGRDWDANERNLDAIYETIAASGCDVFVGDLWERCLKDVSPEAVDESLKQHQAVVEELGVHSFLVQQQRSKDVEAREDKRPTREGMKGSSSYLEVADTILAPFRPAQWKAVEDDCIQCFILKQRYGRWPLAVEFDWDGDTGRIAGGRTISYEPPAGESERDLLDEPGRARGRGGKRKPKRW